MISKKITCLCIILGLCLIFFQCSTKQQSNLHNLQQQSQPNASLQPQHPLSPPSNSVPELVEMDRENIQNAIRSIVDGYEVLGLSQTDLNTIVVGETEFIEIEDVFYSPNNVICEVKFNFFLIPLEFKNQTLIESDGMFFEVSKQFQRGIAFFEYHAGEWNIKTMHNEFRQIIFLSNTERK